MKSITFSGVKIGQGFKCNGNYCIKKSKRTAMITEFSKVFYYHKNEIVKINNQ